MLKQRVIYKSYFIFFETLIRVKYEELVLILFIDMVSNLILKKLLWDGLQFLIIKVASVEIFFQRSWIWVRHAESC